MDNPYTVQEIDTLVQSLDISKYYASRQKFCFIKYKGNYITIGDKMCWSTKAGAKAALRYFLGWRICYELFDHKHFPYICKKTGQQFSRQDAMALSRKVAYVVVDNHFEFVEEF